MFSLFYASKMYDNASVYDVSSVYLLIHLSINLSIYLSHCPQCLTHTTPINKSLLLPVASARRTAPPRAVMTLLLFMVLAEESQSGKNILSASAVEQNKDLETA